MDTTISLVKPNEGESIIDYQNRLIALRNRAIKIQELYSDISDEKFNVDDEPIII